MQGQVIRLDPRATSVCFSGQKLQIDLADGRAIQVPLHWSHRLARATAEQRKNYMIAADGRVVSWPEIDEDISVEALLKADSLIDWPDDL